MKKILLGTLLFSLSTCGPSAPAYARDAMLYGPGAQYCKNVVVADDEHIKRFSLIFFWVQGYVSARNYQVFKDTGNGFDPMPKVFDTAAQFKFVVEYCVANPDKDVSDAADAITSKLETLESLQGVTPSPR